MARMPLIINDVDFSALTERLGYSISYEDVVGGNSMIMANGDRYEDVVVRKPTITWRLDSLTGGQLAQLHAAINAAIYVPVTYYDTAAGTALTAYFHGVIASQDIGAIRGAGSYRFEGPTLTLKAR